MGLFDSFLKRKSQEEEARLLLEEISWRITEEEVGLRRAREERLLDRFARFWEIDGAQVCGDLSDRELPQVLLPRGGEPEDAAQALRAILEEVWLRGQGRCRLCHRDRGLGFRERAEIPPGADEPVRAPSSELLRAVGDGDESDSLLEPVEDEPESGRLAQAKRRRKERRLERERRAERRRLAARYELLCDRCRGVRVGFSLDA